eukprot:jgi/Chrzof1/13610/Cz08g04030.t1
MPSHFEAPPPPRLCFIDQQALESKDAGVQDVVRLLQQPEDLGRLFQLRAEYDSKYRSNKVQLTATVQSQVEAARYGLELLDKSHRHIAKLRVCIDKIDHLCGECTSLVENHEKIRGLSYAHNNLETVLEELEDIIDLPSRAVIVEELLQDDANLVRAFEGLTMLEGTGNNVKEAWRRNVKKRQDIGELMQYLNQVSETMTTFERRLWSHIRNYHDLAVNDPKLLVDCVRIIEIQEKMDAHYIATKAGYIRPRHYKERALLEMEAAVGKRFQPLLALCGQHGQTNCQVKYDQEGNRVVSEQRDYLGALVDVVRVDAHGKTIPGATDAELATLVIREEETFHEDDWVAALLYGFGQLEGELPEAYDFVAPSFPPHYNIFDSIFQMYHIQFAQAVDIIGQSSASLSTKSQLAIMEWVSGYQSTLRGLGVEEEMVCLPVAPLSDPEGQPGLRMLIESYTSRMETTISSWYKNILEVDMNGAPQQMSDGTLRTPGAVDFFRILNEQVAILDDISRGEVLFAASQRSLKVMRDFTAAQQALLGRGLGLEMLCALLNNNIDCYNQSLEFTEQVQAQLEDGFKEQLDVEETCRGFLELAKSISRRIVDLIFADTGMAELLKKLCTHAEWLNGTTTATIIATINDYFLDVGTFVEPSFSKRIFDVVLDELVRRYATALAAALPAVNDAMVKRMTADERDIQTFFERFLALDKVIKHTAQLSDLKDMLTADSPEGVACAYASVLDVNPAITPAMVEKLCSTRPTMSKAQMAEMVAQAQEVYTQKLKRGPGAAAAAAAMEGSGAKGWKFWGRGGAAP